jgi:hypothetical protein
MSQPFTRSSALALVLACLFATGCRDKHEPVKPTVSAPAAASPTA